MGGGARKNRYSATPTTAKGQNGLTSMRNAPPWFRERLRPGSGGDKGCGVGESGGSARNVVVAHPKRKYCAVCRGVLTVTPRGWVCWECGED